MQCLCLVFQQNKAAAKRKQNWLLLLTAKANNVSSDNFLGISIYIVLKHLIIIRHLFVVFISDESRGDRNSPLEGSYKYLCLSINEGLAEHGEGKNNI